jgi:hypothetical protein
MVSWSFSWGFSCDQQASLPDLPSTEHTHTKKLHKTDTKNLRDRTTVLGPWWMLKDARRKNLSTSMSATLHKTDATDLMLALHLNHKPQTIITRINSTFYKFTSRFCILLALFCQVSSWYFSKFTNSISCATAFVQNLLSGVLLCILIWTFIELLGG